MLGRALTNQLQKFPKFELDLPTRDKLDLSSRLHTLKYLSEKTPNLVIHCAAKVGGIKFNLSNKHEMFYSNVEIDKNIIQTSYSLGIKNLVYFASSCMYPINHYRSFKEDDILKGEIEKSNLFYALAKISATEYMKCIDANLDFNYKTFVLSNLFGPGDTIEIEKAHMISSAIVKILQAKKKGDKFVEIWGTSGIRREFTFTGDVAKWICENVENLINLPSILNLGVGVDFTIIEFYQKIAKIVGYSGDFKFINPELSGVKSKLMDSQVAQHHFNWSPEADLTEGLKVSIEDVKKRIGF
jgi:GDP-L-fucose synthase